jgi:hypothetical protein
LALLRSRIKLSDGDNRWFSTTRFDKDLSKFTSREELEKLSENQIEGAMQDKIDELRQRYENVVFPWNATGRPLTKSGQAHIQF